MSWLQYLAAQGWAPFPSAIDLGEQEAGATSQKVMQVRNPTAYPLELAWSVIGALGDDVFTIEGPKELAPGQQASATLLWKVGFKAEPVAPKVEVRETLRVPVGSA